MEFYRKYFGLFVFPCKLYCNQNNMFLVATGPLFAPSTYTIIVRLQFVIEIQQSKNRKTIPIMFTANRKKC